MPAYNCFPAIGGNYSATGAVETLVPLTAANKTCSIALTNALSPYINDANAWTTRYNAGLVRMNAWNGTISFQAIAGPSEAGAEVNGDFAVVQFGNLVATGSCATDGVAHRVTVSGLVPGQPFEIWETTQNRYANGTGVNSGLDIKTAAGYVTGLYLPANVSAPTPATCTTGIIWLTNSIPNSVTDQSVKNWYAPIGLARRYAHQKGWLLGDLTQGGSTFSGDGPTPAQRAADVVRLHTAMGSPTTLKIYLDQFRNDYAYAGLHGVTTTPAQGTTDAGTFKTTLAAALPGVTITWIVNTTISQTSEGAVAGATLPDWRTQIATLSGSGWTVISGTALNITKPTYRDDVHLTSDGSGRYSYGPSSSQTGVLQALGLI